MVWGERPNVGGHVVLEQVRLEIIIVCLIIMFLLIVIIHIYAFVLTIILVFIRRDDLNMMVEGAWNLGVTGECLSPRSFAVGWETGQMRQIDHPPIFGFSFPYSGLGVSVTILDDGIEKDHPDLIRYFCLQCQILQSFIFKHILFRLFLSAKSILHNYFCRNYDPLSSTDVNDNDR